MPPEPAPANMKVNRKFLVRSKEKIKLPNGIILQASTTIDDPIQAHQCLEFGCEVLDAETGKEAFSNPLAEKKA